MNRSFLHEVAADLYDRCGEALSDLVVLFPSRRARLFFVDALAQIVRRPLWQPRWSSIDELMREVAGLQPGDRLRLITELFRVYVKYHPHETFDKFYFWGDMLLTDFDTIDKYLIDADMLFRNIAEIRELEADVSYLTPEQLKIIAFWSSIGQESSLSEEKRKFLAVWKTLRPIYHEYTDRLRQLGLAYGGMIQREAAGRLKRGEYAFDAGTHYVVAGFNALSECEKRLFKAMSASATTDFYWDSDDYYTNDPAQEAGMFVRGNAAMFPARGAVSHDCFRRPKEFTVVSAVSNVVQCKHAATVLRELAKEGRLDKETAVVLTDENLLMPLLYALPPEAGKVNVTMGYPLKQTLAYSFVERLIGLQSHCRTKGEQTLFYHVDAAGILAHPYVVDSNPELTARLQEEIVEQRRITVEASRLWGSDLLRRIFTPAREWRELSDYLLATVEAVARLPYEGDDARQRVEFLAVIAEHLAKLRNSLDECGIEVTAAIYTSLLRRHLQQLRIPFEGEPLEGVQVMGILETRNLDFRNVLILSMNDDNFPGNHLARPSFVPYNLRAAYGMPTPEHHEGVYAYYFYRLVQRAERVWMIYCSHADDKSTGEPSRYIRQLDFESGFPLRKVEVGVDVNLAPAEPIEVPKTGGVLAGLARFTAPDDPVPLSPTAFFRYVACPLRFYFYSVARLKVDDELSEEVDAPMFGTLLHAAVQRLYEGVLQVEHPGEQLRARTGAGEVERAVTRAINEHYLRDPEATERDYTGNLLLVRDIVIRYIHGGLIPYDAAHDGFAVLGLEQPVSHDFRFTAAGSEMRVRFAGVADRIDSLDSGQLRIVDYKTGAQHLDFAGIEALFRGEGKERQSNILQTLLYSMIMHYTTGREVVPALYYVRYMNRPDYSPWLSDRELNRKGEPYSVYRERFEVLLRETLAELFDPGVPFRQCTDAEHTCRYCDYRSICRR